MGIPRDYRGVGQVDAATRLCLARDVAGSEAAKNLPLRHHQMLGRNEADGRWKSHEESNRRDGNEKCGQAAIGSLGNSAITFKTPILQAGHCAGSLPVSSRSRS